MQAPKKRTFEPPQSGFEFEDGVPLTRAGRIAILLVLVALILQCTVLFFG